MLPILLLLGWSAFLFVTNFFICSGDLASTGGSFVADLLALANFTACDGTPEWFSFVLILLTYLPLLAALLLLFAPILGGLMANPVVGTIAAAIIAGGVIAGLAAVITSAVT